MGYSRPSTGGSANLIEMQSLFIHKLITDSEFHKNIHHNLEARIEKYNLEYYSTPQKRNIDHLVYYGYYTHEIAKLLGIATSLSDCRSIKDILQYYLSPNNAYKYRQEGPYKVEGAREMSEKIWKEHKGFSFIKHFVLNYLFIQATVLLLICLLPIPLYVIIPLCLIQLLNPFVGFLHSYGTNLHKYFNFALIGGLIATVFYPSPWTPTITLASVAMMTLIARKSGWTRLLFNDLKHKKTYSAFFKRYLHAYRNVLEKQQEKPALMQDEKSASKRNKKKPKTIQPEPIEN